MRNKRMVLAAALVLLTGFVAASSSQAGRAASRAHHLTVSAPVALPGIVRAPGGYIFEVPDGHADLVRVRARDTGRALFMAFTESVPRPTSLPADAVITLDEAPVGQAQPITAWFPMGESTGHRFIYR
jgi:hypothetical protein